jgi:hypothetical protein
MAVQPLGTVAPEERPVTALVQSYHWYDKVGVGIPLADAAAVRTCPWLAAPDSVGVALKDGAVSGPAAAIAAAAIATALGVVELAAVTMTVTYFATSVAVNV